MSGLDETHALHRPIGALVTAGANPPAARAAISLRRRLALIAGLGVLLFAGSALAFVGMRREFQDRLVERAQFEAERALVRVDASNAEGGELVEECSVGTTRAGASPPSTLDGARLGVDEATAARLRASLPPPGARPHVELARAAVPVVLAARMRGDGEASWAAVAIAVPRVVRFWKLVVAALALVFVALVGAAVDAVRVVRRAAFSLEGSARALAGDLGARVAEPGVEELGGVVEALRGMAGALAAAQRDREVLHDALAREQRHAALGRIAAALAHEIRNPLAAIKLRVDLAREGSCDEAERRGDLDVLGREIERLDRLVTDLLVHVRTAPRATEEHELAALVEERAALLSPWARARGVELRVRGRGRASIDRDGFARAVDNLLRNAVEASPEGRAVDVEVRARDGVLEIDVLDDGPGVGAAHEASLFEPFFTTKPKGTGLGLSLAKAVVRGHGGELGYDRDAGRTRFRMTIPDGQRS